MLTKKIELPSSSLSPGRSSSSWIYKKTTRKINPAPKLKKWKDNMKQVKNLKQRGGKRNTSIRWKDFVATSDAWAFKSSTSKFHALTPLWYSLCYRENMIRKKKKIRLSISFSMPHAFLEQYIFSAWLFSSNTVTVL